MTLFLNVEYRTAPEEVLVLNILEGDDVLNTSQHPMSTHDGQHWFCELERSTEPGTYIDYYYSTARNGAELRHEWMTEPHRLEFAATKATRYTVYDHWIDIPEDAHLYSSAFTECVMSRKRALSTKSEFQQTVRLKVRAPQLQAGQRLAIVGSPDILGAWDVRQAVAMTEHQYHEWVVSLDAAQLPADNFEFKFIILSEKPKHKADEKDRPFDDALQWEQSMNRALTIGSIHPGEVVVYELPQACFPVYPWKGAGTVIPVFSLRSEGSFGIGDFGDLKLMVDWAEKTGQRVIQVLPINDTCITHTWQDSYPYNSISIYALHPQYTDFRQLPPLKDTKRKRYFEKLRKELNALPKIDYERMSEAKMDYLHELFQQEWPSMKRKASYKQFFEQNKEWLVPYAAFCYYRDKYGTANFSAWPAEATVDAIKTTYPNVQFWFFVQYNLDQQMHAAHDYARKHRVILKGDIPIGISRDGVEAWVEPKYFNLNGQAGAPPDIFATDGQNWGFPTYNWDEMLQDGCSWWVHRFRKMAQYFDAYRIDHVLGFFRIWEIPVPEKSGLMGQFSPALGLSREEIEAWGMGEHMELFLIDHKRNDRWHPRINVQYHEDFQKLSDDEQHTFNRLYDDYFYHRNNQFWYEEAMKKLPRLTQATRMLVCAEDLGMVPECVPWVMNELRILSLEIQSMPKELSRFGHLSRNPYRSVCTISTHDMPTLRQWWDEDEERTQDYYESMLFRSGTAPHPLPGWLAKDIVSRHLTSPSMLCLLSLQDWLATDEKLRLPDADAERINIPANPRHYWRYRMHLTIEELLRADEFNESIKTLVTQSGRN